MHSILTGYRVQTVCFSPDTCRVARPGAVESMTVCLSPDTCRVAIPGAVESMTVFFSPDTCRVAKAS